MVGWCLYNQNIKYLQIAFEVFFHSGVLAQGTSKKVIGV